MTRISMFDGFEGRTWWYRGKPYSRPELILDGVVHGVGLVIALAAGGILLALTAPSDLPSIAVYIGSLVAVLAISLAFNLAPANAVKRLLARLDQAAIFLLIAGTYTPILALLSGAANGPLVLALVWGAAVIGIALKLLVPQHFGRLAIALYLGIAWSGILVFQALAEALPHPNRIVDDRLGNPLYIGDITHKGERHKGQHQAIIDDTIWIKGAELRKALPAVSVLVCNAWFRR